MYNTSVHLYIYPLHGNSLLSIEIICWFDCYRLLRNFTLKKILYCAYYIELVQIRDWDVVILQLSSVHIVHTLLNWCKVETEMCLYCSCLLFILCILYWTVAKQRMRCGYTAAVFCLYCAYCIELVQSGDWDVVIMQLSSVYIVHTVLNWCKGETEMWLYCSCLQFILCILYWTVAKQRLRCGYTAAVFCLYCAYCIELVQSGDWDVVILQLSSVYIVHTLLNWCKAETEMWLYWSCLLFILWILYWTAAKQRLRCCYTAAVFCLYCAYCIEPMQSGGWDVVILQLSSVYIVHIELNWCKAETEMRLYCSWLLFILCILYWTGAKQRLKCGYTAAVFCFYKVSCVDWNGIFINFGSSKFCYYLVNFIDFKIP